MFSATLNKYCRFYLHIFKSFVFLGEGGVVGEEAIHNLGRGLYVARLGHKTIFVAEIVILLH